jgi:FSR family fosmidomycin resistance protein-like MFS transporter
LFASGIGGFLGGPAADRYGARRVIVWSLVASSPFLFAAPRLEGIPFMVALAVGGFFLQSTLPVNVVFGQAIAPVSAATVSSLMMGFAWGTGGMTVPLTGYVADRAGIENTLVGLAVVPLLAALCALPLPKGSGRSGQSGSSGGPVVGPSDPLNPSGPSAFSDPSHVVR